MTEALAIEERLRRFVAAPDEADWQDVLSRADLQPVARANGSLASRPGVRRWRSWKGGLVIVIAVVALAYAAVSIAGGSPFGFSNQGRRGHVTPSVRRVLNGQMFRKLGLPYSTYRTSTFKVLAFRQGIGLYTARTKKRNRLCYFRSQRQAVVPEGCAPEVGGYALPERLEAPSRWKGMKEHIREENAWFRDHPFPSPTRPLLDMSAGVLKGTFVYPQLAGLAANGVRSVQLLALSDCHPLVTVPVINNVYIDAHTPKVRAAFLVARNGNGKIIWHSAKSYLTTPTERVPLDHKLPPNCGLR